jgi:hypothetical protein
LAYSLLIKPQEHYRHRRAGNHTLPSIMKAPHKTKNSSCRIEVKNMTLGDLIAATYGACGEQRAPKILQLAIDSHLVRFKR